MKLLDTIKNRRSARVLLAMPIIGMSLVSMGLSAQNAHASHRQLPMAQIRTDFSQAAGIIGRQMGAYAEYSCYVRKPEYAVCTAHLWGVRSNGRVMNCDVATWQYFEYTSGYTLAVAPYPAGSRCVYAKSDPKVMTNQMARNVVVQNLTPGWWRNIYRTPSLL